VTDTSDTQPQDVPARTVARRRLQSLGLTEHEAIALLLPVIAETYREVADDAKDGAGISNVWGETPSVALTAFAEAYRQRAADCDLPGAPMPDTSPALVRERALHEEHRQQLATALGEGDTGWGYLLDRVTEIRAGRDRADDTSTRLSREVTSLREGIGQLRAEGEQVRTAVCDALGGNLVDWPEAISRVRKGIADRDGLRTELREQRDLAGARSKELATTLRRGPGADWYAIHAAAAEAVKHAETAEQEARDARQGETEAVRARKAAEARARGAERATDEWWTTTQRQDAVLRRAEADLARVREVASRLAAHAQGFRDILDDTDRGPWGNTVGTDLAELLAALGDDQAAEACPGRETTPNRCTCDCEGCKHNCGAHQSAEPDLAAYTAPVSPRAALQTIPTHPSN
jgi:hypothetical protein